MSTEYYLQIDNQQAGPYTLQQIGAMVADGSVPVTTLFWKDGQADWEPLTQLGFEPPRTFEPPPPPGPPPLSSVRPPPLREAARAVPSGPQKTSTLAVWSLILGILSFIFFIFTAIPAVTFGHISLGHIKQSRGALTGRGLAIAGLVLGYLWLCLLPFILVGIALPAFEAAKSAALEVRSMSQMKQMGLACREYAADHHGDFPPSLNSLFPKYLQDQSILASPLYPADPNGYTYTAGLNASSPPDAVLIEDKYAPAKRVRVVVMVDDSGRVIRNQPVATPF
jgi:hypothetical protein